MKLIVVAVRDRAIDAFMRPFFAQSVGQAVRSFTDEVNRASDDNNLYRHADDHDLYKLGVFDPASGEFSELTKEQIAIGKNVKIRKE